MQTIKRSIKKYMKQLNTFFLMAFISSPLYAALPTPPANDMASSSKNWIAVGGSLINQVLRYSAIAIGALILLGVAGGILKAYHVSQERGELSHFFKMLVIGLVVAAAGLGLVYAGHQIVTE